MHLAWRLLTEPAGVARLLDDASPWRDVPPRQVRVMRWHMDFTRAAWGRPRRGPHDTELPVTSASSPLWCARGPELWYGWDLWHALVAGTSHSVPLCVQCRHSLALLAAPAVPAMQASAKFCVRYLSIRQLAMRSGVHA